MKLCNSITQKWSQTDPCKDTLQSGKTEFNEMNLDVYCRPCQLSGYQPALLILYKQLCNWFPSISCRGAKKFLFLLLSLSPCHPPWQWIGVRGKFWDHLKRVDKYTSAPDGINLYKSSRQTSVQTCYNLHAISPSLLKLEAWELKSRRVRKFPPIETCIQL